MRSVLSLFMMFLLVPVTWSAPPTITAPSEVTGDVSAFVTIRAVATGSKWIRYQPIDGGLSVFPSDLLSDKTVTVVVAAKEGRYHVLAYTGNEDGGADVIVTVIIGKSTKLPTKPPTNPPVTDPPPQPVIKATFLIGRKNGPADQSYIDVLRNSAWDDLVKSGHKVKEMTLDEIVSIYKVPSGTPVPFVVTLQETVNGSKVIVGPVALPTTSDGIKDLVKGVQ